jgi:hypothetical protein
MIPLTGPESLFVRIGHIGGLVDSVNAYRGTTIPPKIDTLNSDYSTTDQAVVNGIYATLLAFQNSMSGFLSSLQSQSSNTVIAMANDSQLQVNNSLSTALGTLIGQMQASGATVQSCSLSSTVSPGASNAGNALVLVGLKGGTGLVQENSFAEVIAGTVTNDAQSGSAVAGQETINFQGQQSVSPSLSWLYPAGSGASRSITCINANSSQNSGTQNNLYNSNFEIWSGTPNVPNGWNVQVGTPGTTILQSSAHIYDGSFALKIVGNGAELTSIYETFSLSGVSGGTRIRIQPSTQYAVNLMAYVDVVPAAGAAQIALVDENNNIINDSNGVPNNIAVTLTTASAAVWAPINGFFRTPRVLPSSIAVRIGLSIPMSVGSNLWIDHMALAQPVQFYQGGPSLAAFSLNENLILGDSYTLTINNNYGSFGFQFLFNQLFNMSQLGYLLPSSNSPTIPASLIT